MGGDPERQKSRKCQLIETHWRCNIQASIPAHIKPRAGVYKSSKAKVGTNAPAAPPSEWSLEILTELERLASMTVGKLVLAQELMTLEVQQRQQDWTNSQKDVAEILRSDLKKINTDLTERALQNGNADDFDDDDDDKSDEDEVLGVDGDTKQEADVEPMNVKIKHEHSDADVDMVTDDQVETKPVITEDIDSRSKSNLKTRAKIATLRADAMRLKQEAARREAEAYELEAKMLREEAKKAAQ